VTVGLDKLIDLGIAEPNGEPPRRTVRDAGDDGTELTR
jgi:4-hydroxy-tetrahydrodipicolinate reductase